MSAERERDDFDRLLEVANDEEHPDGHVLVFLVNGTPFLEAPQARTAWDHASYREGERELEITWMDPKPAPRKFRKRSDSLLHGNEEIEITCEGTEVHILHSINRGAVVIVGGGGGGVGGAVVKTLRISEPDLLRSLADALEGFAEVLEHNRGLAELTPLEKLLAESRTP